MRQPAVHHIALLNHANQNLTEVQINNVSRLAIGVCGQNLGKHFRIKAASGWVFRAQVLLTQHVTLTHRKWSHCHGMFTLGAKRLRSRHLWKTSLRKSATSVPVSLKSCLQSAKLTVIAKGANQRSQTQEGMKMAFVSKLLAVPFTLVLSLALIISVCMVGCTEPDAGGTPSPPASSGGDESSTDGSGSDDASGTSEDEDEEEEEEEE